MAISPESTKKIAAIQLATNVRAYIKALMTEDMANTILETIDNEGGVTINVWDVEEKMGEELAEQFLANASSLHGDLIAIATIVRS